jgi:guanylate kinase
MSAAVDSHEPGATGRSGTVYIVSAPSGAGKTTLVRGLTERNGGIRVSVSHTTRPPRPDERDGEDYFFVDDDRFRNMVAAGEFLEHARVFDHCYGTSRLWVQQQITAGIDVILEIDWQGARQARSLLSNSIGIFILPPSLHMLRQRLEKRGDAQEIIARRMRDAAVEISHYREYDYLVLNDSVERALDDLAAIVRATRCGYAAQRRFLDALAGALLQETDVIR